jgi:hypothetical protein
MQRANRRQHCTTLVTSNAKQDVDVQYMSMFNVNECCESSDEERMELE